MGAPPPSSSPSASPADARASELARASLELHALRNRLTEGINAGQRMDEVLAGVVDAVLCHGLAGGALLTLKPWSGNAPELLLARPESAEAWWPSFRGTQELDRAHRGERVAWSVQVGAPQERVDCFSFCFSTDGRGAIAITGVGSPRARAMYRFRLFLSASIEHLLIRDGLMKSVGSGGPLKDMAEWTWATLDAADEALEQIEASAEGSAERMAAESHLLMKTHELCQYTHIDDGLAEVSSSLLVVTHEAHTGPFTLANVAALRDVFQWMRAISLSDADSDRCLDRLEEGGLDIYDAFGEDEHDPEHS